MNIQTLDPNLLKDILRGQGIEYCLDQLDVERVVGYVMKRGYDVVPAANRSAYCSDSPLSSGNTMERGDNFDAMLWFLLAFLVLHAYHTLQMLMGHFSSK
jgi:hypothetical protein